MGPKALSPATHPKASMFCCAALSAKHCHTCIKPLQTKYRSCICALPQQRRQRMTAARLSCIKDTHDTQACSQRTQAGPLLPDMAAPSQSQTLQTRCV